MLSFAVFEYTKYNYFMPRIIPDGKFHSRWTYENVEYMGYNDCDPFVEDKLDLESSAIALDTYDRKEDEGDDSNELQFDLDDLELTNKQEEENRARFNMSEPVHSSSKKK